MTTESLPPDAVYETVQPAGKTAGLGAGTRERIENVVRGYKRADEDKVTPDQLRRDLNFEGYPNEVIEALVENIFFDGKERVFPPYEVVKEDAERVTIGKTTWQADRDTWPTTRWTTLNSDAINTTQLHDRIRREGGSGERVVVEGPQTAIFEREKSLE